MPVKDAGNSGEWQVTTKGATWGLAKLVGDDEAAVTSPTLLTPSTASSTQPEAKAQSLLIYGTAGGRIGIIVKTTDPLYSRAKWEGERRIWPSDIFVLPG
jgi:hypothetical protein